MRSSGVTGRPGPSAVVRPVFVRGRMRLALGLALAAGCGSGTMAGAPAAPTAPTAPSPVSSSSDTPASNPGNWTLVKSDDFDGGAVDGGLWDTHWHEASGDGKARFQAWYPSASGDGSTNVALGGGTATITAKQEAWYKGASWARGGQGYDYSSGVLQDGFKRGYTYGYFEARLRGPASNARGTDADFFLFARDFSWPPEVDVVEMPGTNAAAQFLTNVHWSDGGNKEDYRYIPVTTSDWHTYALLWQPGLLAWYVDGKEVRRTRDHVPTKEMFLDLAIEVNGGAGTPFTGIPRPARGRRRCRSTT